MEGLSWIVQAFFHQPIKAFPEENDLFITRIKKFLFSFVFYISLERLFSVGHFIHVCLRLLLSFLKIV